MKRASIAAAIVLGSLSCRPSEPETGTKPETKETPVEVPIKGDFKDWPTACETLKKSLSESEKAAADTVFAKTPKSIEIPPMWELKWRGISVPIPETEYQAVLFSHGEGPGQIEVTLEGIDAVVTVGYLRKESADHATVVDQDFDENPAFIEQWNNAFGHFPKTRSAALGYRSTVADLRCDAATAADDLLTWYGFKNVEDPAKTDKTVYAFSVPGFPTGLSRYTPSETAQQNWEIVMLPESSVDHPRRVTYSIASDGALADIGHFIGIDYDRSETHRPEWIGAMESVFTMFDRPNVDRLEATFRATDIKTRGTIGKLRGRLGGKNEQ